MTLFKNHLLFPKHIAFKNVKEHTCFDKTAHIDKIIHELNTPIEAAIAVAQHIRHQRKQSSSKMKLKENTKHKNRIYSKTICDCKWGRQTKKVKVRFFNYAAHAKSSKFMYECLHACFQRSHWVAHKANRIK